MTEEIDVVIVGAGHIGLSTSFFLKKAGVSHLVLEKNSVASTWKTARWDSFHLVLPNWTLQLPAFPYRGKDPDGFLDLAQTIQYVEDFANHFQLPVRSSCEVLELQFKDQHYLLKTSQGLIKARSVVIAAGAFHQPRIPEISNSLPKMIRQRHSSQYRNPSALSDGAVLVVGTGQSGAQIADELHQHGRKVFLSVSRCGGRPRRYRGQDCVWWMQQRGYYNQPSDSEISSNEKRRQACNVPLTGQNGGIDINLNEFSEKGIQLLGRLIRIENNHLKFSSDLAANLQHADEEWLRFLTDCDQYAQLHNLSLPEDVQAYGFKKYNSQIERFEIDWIQENITEVIWATGFSPTFPWIPPAICDETGFPIHKKGLTDQAGLFFVGLPWQSHRKSTLFLGSTQDAETISKHVAKYLITS